LAGIGGYAYVMASSNSTFTANVAGYGFLALAVMIFGNWKPISIMGAAFFFSLFKTISALALDESLSSILPTFNLREPIYLYRMLPYVITMIVLAFTSKKSRAPKAEGIPYDPGKR
jgi:general nucleoside transport system permease protein